MTKMETLSSPKYFNTKGLIATNAYGHKCHYCNTLNVAIHKHSGIKWLSWTSVLISIEKMPAYTCEKQIGVSDRARKIKNDADRISKYD